MLFLKRCATTKTLRFSSTDFDQVRHNFSLCQTFIEFEDITDSLILNWDQTALYYVHVCSWTMAREGSKHIEIQGIDDKHQITDICVLADVAIFCHPRSFTKER